jgi:hypothetical protein
MPGSGLGMGMGKARLGDADVLGDLLVVVH